MKRTKDRIENLAFGRRWLWYFSCNYIVAADLWLRKQEVLDLMWCFFVVGAVMRSCLLKRLLYVQSVVYAVALLSWPTKSSEVDNTIKTILPTTMAGFVLRLRL